MITNPADEVEVDVTWEDQKMINTFGRLNTKMHEYEDERKVYQDELTNLQDASNELLLTDDDSPIVRYQIGDSFFLLPKEEVEELIEKKEASLTGEIGKLNDKIGEIKEVLGSLKIKLYAKFRNSINLEENEP
eukprot:TRINITY_DN21012_c0_g1_i1.p1 TRINITY_DN21012_c0_g1~~TRINITY_DN21012_c0_g1_i1.p1  ORF type:complete len:148 (-),score=43.53 TRINITY_DN21012_c0_g1_i1:331-729(-)